MPRHLRVKFPGAIYHVTIRGNARQNIFVDDHDRWRFLTRLAESVETYGVRLYLFCLMNNHVHLVLETPDTNLSRFMQSLETGYTVYYNLRHGTSGHLFQGRYGAKLVEGDEYLLKLSRYVHLNAVFVGRVKGLPLGERISCLRDYRWSSYRSYIGKEKRLKYVAYGPILAQAGAKKSRQQREYRRFVEEGVAETDRDFRAILKGSALAIGGDGFCAWVRDLCNDLAEKAAKPEDVSFRRQIQRLASAEVLEVVSRHVGVSAESLREKRRNSLARPVAARMLVKYAGLTNREIAGILGVKSGVAVGMQARKAIVAMQSDKKAARLITAIEEDLQRCMSDVRPV